MTLHLQAREERAVEFGAGMACFVGVGAAPGAACLLGLEAALEPWIRTVAEHSPDILYVVDTRQRRARFLNRDGLLGYSGQELDEADDILGRIHPDDEAEGRAAWARLLNAPKGTLVTTEYRLQNREGGWDWVRNRRRVVETDETGRVVTVLATLSVITAHKEAEERLRASEARYRLLADHSDDVIFRLTPTGIIQFASEAAQRMLGYSPEELVGRPLAFLFHAEDRDVAARQGEAAAVRDAYTVTARLVRRDGRALWTESTNRVARDPGSGRMLHVTSVVRDVEERKDMEARLRQSDRMQALGALAAGAAHEINNPLTYILANVEFAAEVLRRLESALAPHPELVPLMEDARAALKDAGAGAARVRGVVQELQLYARPDSRGRQNLDVEELLDRAITLAGGHVRNRAALVRHSGMPPAVLADGAAVVHALVNLLLHAARVVQPGPDGIACVTVRTGASSTGGAYVAVEHTGQTSSPPPAPGAAAPVSRDPAGMALSLAQEAAENAGGALVWQALDGGATRLRLDLPSA